MDHDRVDLSILDPTADEQRWDRMIRGIMERAAPELARRAMVVDPFAAIVQWARPMIATAAALAAVALTLMLRAPGPGDSGAATSLGTGHALLPAPVADWLDEDRSPTVTDLVWAMEDNNR